MFLGNVVLNVLERKTKKEVKTCYLGKEYHIIYFYGKYNTYRTCNRLESIREIIREEKTDKHCKGYDTWSQFTECGSVHDISNRPNSANGNLSHLEIGRAQ